VRNSAELFKALADETRLRILNLLVRGELCVCDIMTVLDIGQSKVSRHLACLRNVTRQRPPQRRMDALLAGQAERHHAPAGPGVAGRGRD